MKRVTSVFLLAVFSLSGCGATDDAELTDSDSAVEDSTFSGNAAEASAVADDDGAWFVSDERPVNRACNDPSYRSGQPDIYPSLDSPMYPVIHEKSQALLARVQELAPQVTDEDIYDLEADLRARAEMNILSQFVFVVGQDLAPRYLINICDVVSYDDDQCALMQRFSQSTVTLSDFERTGDSLRYNAKLANGDQGTLTIANRDLDGLRLQFFSPTDGNYIGEWTRAADGTETFNATSEEGTFSYTENPDCSGVASAVRTDDGGHLWELKWQWPSVREPATFQLQYLECKVNGLDERECIDGLI